MGAAARLARLTPARSSRAFLFPGHASKSTCLTFYGLHGASSVSLSASESPPDLPSDTGAGQMLDECSLREKAREARRSRPAPAGKA